MKHGDLDSSLLTPSKEIDVHMDAKGLNYSCVRCHTTYSHKISGRHYTEPAPNDHQLALPKDTRNRIGCESCHGPAPHKLVELNHHTRKIACQTCHIPYVAKKLPTKVWWDWSKAGKHKADGSLLVKKDRDGKIIYHTKKGEMRWTKNLIPQYRWYSGSLSYITLQEKIDPTRLVEINHPVGGPDDPNSKIFPFKIFYGVLPYDADYKTLVVPKLFGKKGTGAFWAEFDWEKSVRAGMKAAGAQFSGKLGFVKTATYWPLSHMVAPKDKALACDACHTENGRLKGIEGIYIPGRDRNRLLDATGWIIVGLTLTAVLIHALLRINGRKNHS